MPTITIQPTDDTTGKDTLIMSGASADTNYGAGIQLYLGYRSATEETARILIQFDLQAIPTRSIINSATLSLYAESTDESETGDRTYGVYRNTAAWTESTVTWNTAPTVDATPDATTVVVANTTGYKDWNVATLVQEWVNGTSNFGVTIKNATDGQKPQMNYSSSGRGSNYPKLVINFTPAQRGAVLAGIL